MLSRIPTELSLKSNPFPDMLLKLQLAIVLPVATETFVLQLMKLQSVSNMLLLAVALIAQDAEFSTMHLSNVILDSDTHSKQFSATFSNFESFACIFPLGPNEYTHFWQSCMLQLVRYNDESLDLQPNLQPANVEFLTSQIASESIMSPHIPLKNLQSLRLVC